MKLYKVLGLVILSLSFMATFAASFQGESGNTKPAKPAAVQKKLQTNYTTAECAARERAIIRSQLSRFEREITRLRAEIEKANR